MVLWNLSLTVTTCVVPTYSREWSLETPSPIIEKHWSLCMWEATTNWKICFILQVDGGLGPSTVDVAASAGANCIVAGSSVFGASEPGQVISLLRKSVQGAQQNNWHGTSQIHHDWIVLNLFTVCTLLICLMN